MFNILCVDNYGEVLLKKVKGEIPKVESTVNIIDDEKGISDSYKVVEVSYSYNVFKDEITETIDVYVARERGRLYV